ncbi:MAG: bifunctional proline dehydrogenase/L-glutamate gamma-semialdehyde dehydrogenase PutA, partial [Comamonas sp.]|nr:bifunctional proline dehydrogenase/L-glutamate gamma-semialdehyde dehydrogenase PutA [Comamonas sp.]
DGLAGYPVYTRKVYTDVSYLACARKLLEVPDAIYPQFATHNAQTLATIYHLAQTVGGSYYSGQYEFQCLHGMGEPLYAQVTGAIADGKLARPCRVYAPVGNHETLLAYLVRRLLENGANTSFVNRIGDPSVPVAELVADPVDEVMQIASQEGRLGAPHPKIPLPAQLLAQGPQGRANSQGVNLAHEQQLASLAAALLNSTTQNWLAAPAGVPLPADPAQDSQWQPVRNPAELTDVVGWVRETDAEQAQAAAAAAAQAAPIWAGTPPAVRGDVLARAADLLEQRSQLLMGLIVREAGKTLPNAVAEIREAVDFLRYYGAMVADQFDNARERPLGVVLAISPWNFPLAIFAGQVAAALAAGNAVLAKPAEQTPLTAAAMVAILYEAGVPRDALQFVPGQGETVGAALVAHPQVAGVMFTGSTEVARIIAKQLAQRLSPSGQPIPLIAETGGQNAMIVDSSALAEQVVGDVLTSAFDSAGQRCSALRLLCVQADVAERQLTMLREALQEWSLGNPDRQSTDVGPVIDEEARAQIEAHIQQMQEAGQKVTRVQRQDGVLNGHFVAPAIIEIDSAKRLTREVFGPVLHVIRFQRDQIDRLVDDINATGYGLTFGVHSRIDETIDRLTGRIHAGNIYVNRNVVGAVVGVQPFGGMGLSGTGPKAGGPLYLYRLVQGQPNAALAPLPRAQASAPVPAQQLLASLQTTVVAGVEQSGRICAEALAASRLGTSVLLNGPTGESNRYRLLARGPVWALPRTPLGLVHQVAAALATGNPCHVVLPAQDNGCAAAWQALRAAAGDAGVAWLHSADEQSWGDAQAPITALLFEGDGDALVGITTAVAARAGAIVRVESRSSEALHAGHGYDLAALLHEQSISTNTAAAGGNAQLMTMA